MPTFEISGPQGTFEIDAPDEAQAMTAFNTMSGTPPTQKSIDLADVPGMMIENFPDSAAQFGRDIAAPFTDPIGTAKGLGNLGLGVAQKLIPGEQSSEKFADAAGQFFKDRFGGFEEIKRTLATDPVGAFGDLSTVLTGGAALAARAPALAGKAGRIAAKAVPPTRQNLRAISTATKRAPEIISKVSDAMNAASRFTDPLAPLSRIPSGLAEVIGRLGTHTGGESLRTAARAGRAGGEANRAFLENLRGYVPTGNLVDDARTAITNMRMDRSKAYTDEMAALGRGPERVDFNVIDKSFNDTVSKFGRNGLMPKKLRKVTKQVEDTLAEFRNNPERHTPFALDILKQDLYDIQAKFKMKRDSRFNFVNKVRRGVKSAIEGEAPGYAKIMEDYTNASDVIKEIEGALSISPNARVDTSLRKLQSIMRDNVNTSFGHRFDLGEVLVDNGATNLMEKIAGQSLKPAFSRGLGGLQTGLTGLAAFVNPATLAAIPFQMPRVAGEAANLAGRASKVIPNIPRGARLGTFQAGRAGNLLNPGEQQ